MNIESKMSGHWTDDQLIASLYTGSGADANDHHLVQCEACRARLAAMQANRQALESASSGIDPDPARLAGQRRAIYARLSQPARWWDVHSVWRWASAGTAVLVLGGGLFVYQGDMHQPMHIQKESGVSDAQLAQEVSSLAQDMEAQPTAPLKGLFE